MVTTTNNDDEAGQQNLLRGGICMEKLWDLLEQWFPSSSGGALLFSFDRVQQLLTGENFSLVGLDQNCRLKNGKWTKGLGIFFANGENFTDLCIQETNVALQDHEVTMIWGCQVDPTGVQERQYFRLKAGDSDFTVRCLEIESLLLSLNELPYRQLPPSHPLLSGSMGMRL
jgi:hypothetical protein